MLFFQAKEIFQRIYSAEEFLPRAPDPEEIIIEGTPSSNDAENVDFNSSISEDEIREKKKKLLMTLELLAVEFQLVTISHTITKITEKNTRMKCFPFDLHKYDYALIVLVI